MEYIGLNTPPDIYTAAIGMYIVWVTVRVMTAIISKTREGLVCSHETASALDLSGSPE